MTPAPTSGHSRATRVTAGFATIHHDPFAQRGADDGADGFGVRLRFFRGHHDDVFGQAETGECQVDLGCLFSLGTGRGHYNEEVHVAVRPAGATRVGPEEDDAVGIELLDDAPDHFRTGLLRVQRTRWHIGHCSNGRQRITIARTNIGQSSLLKGKVQRLQVNHSTGAHKNVHPDNSVYLKAIIHGAYLDLELAQQLISQLKPVDTA